MYRSYLETGLGVPNAFKLRVTPFQLLETSQIFVATERHTAQLFPRLSVLSSIGRAREMDTVDDAVNMTVTLVGQGRLGLPMESMFGEEVHELRRQGRQLAEVTCLADSIRDPRRSLQTFTELTRAMAQSARYQGVQNLLINVHPRHARFYIRYFGFRPLSDRVANCPHVKDLPAVGLNLDFELYDLEKPRSWHQIFGCWLPRESLRPCPIPAGECALLQEVARLTNPQSPLHLAPPDQRDSRHDSAAA